MGFNSSTQLPNDIRARDVVVYDSNGNIVSPADSTDISALLSELQQKTEPANIQKVEEQTPLDISGLATSDNQTNGTQQTIIKEVAPTNATKTNASYVLSYNASDELVRVVKTIGATSYTKNITPLSGDTVITQTKSIGVWS